MRLFANHQRQRFATIEYALNGVKLKKANAENDLSIWIDNKLDLTSMSSPQLKQPMEWLP